MTVQLGAPFVFDFNMSQDAKTVKIEGKSVLVVGRGKETYQRLWNCVATPEVYLRKAGTEEVL